MTYARSTLASQPRFVVLVLSLGTLTGCAVGCGDDKPPPLAPTPSPAPVSTPASITLHATGTVVENGGGPVPDAIVDVWRCGGDVVLVQTLTGSAGEFSLTVDAPPGNWCVRAHKEGYTWMATAPAEAITLNLQRLRKTTGTVVEVDGSPVPGAKVYADGASTLTDGKGSFSLGASRLFPQSRCGRLRQQAAGGAGRTRPRARHPLHPATDRDVWGLALSRARYLQRMSPMTSPTYGKRPTARGANRANGSISTPGSGS